MYATNGDIASFAPVARARTRPTAQGSDSAATCREALEDAATEASAMAFEPADGMPSEEDLRRAVDEFARLDVNQDAPPLLIASRVPLRAWIETPVSTDFKRVKFLATFDGDASNVDDSTLADVFIEKVPVSDAHSCSVAEMVVQLARQDPLDVLAYGPERTVTVNGHNLQPDLYVRPRWPGAELPEHFPRVIFEVEVDNRRFDDACERCERFFEQWSLPNLRAVVLVKFFVRNPDREFPAVAVHYRRDSDGRGKVFDAVSFGTATLERDTIGDLMGRLRFPHFDVRILEPAPMGQALQTHNPWLDESGAFAAEYHRAARLAEGALADAIEASRFVTAVEATHDNAGAREIAAGQTRLVANLTAAVADAAAVLARIDQGIRLRGRHRETGPFVYLHSADVYYNMRDRNGQLYQATAPCRIDLWRLLCLVEQFR